LFYNHITFYSKNKQFCFAHRLNGLSLNFYAIKDFAKAGNTKMATPKGVVVFGRAQGLIAFSICKFADRKLW